MPVPTFGVCSKCLKCETEFAVTLGGKPLSCETYEQAQEMAKRLKTYTANPRGLLQVLDSALFEPPGVPFFEHITCSKCQAVNERTDLDYWVVEHKDQEDHIL